MKTLALGPLTGRAYYQCVQTSGVRHFILIPLAALVAVFPLAVWGNSCGHDFGFHLRNWLEVGSQWKQGVVVPHWDFTAAWNSGEPRFVFYPPLSWITGAALGLFLPWIAVPTVFIWLALTAAGFTMHRLASEWTTSSRALIAACVYMVNPYMLFTFYERSAYAELLAAAWIPLLLLGILQRRVTVHSIAIPICLLWLSNDPAAVMGCYSFALLSVVRVVFSYGGTQGLRALYKEAAKIAGGAILGIGLAGFYLLPATLEQPWIQMKMPFLRGVRYQDNFAFGHLGDISHDAILRTASICGVILVVLSGVFAVIAFRSGKHESKLASPESGLRSRPILGALGLLTIVVAFLLTAPSAFLWKHVPELKYLQFPWRFCTILGATAAAFSALALRRTKLHPTVAAAVALALTLAGTLVGNRYFRQFSSPAFTAPAIVDDFYRGGHDDPTDEYTPAAADPLALGHANLMFWIAARPTDPSPQTRVHYPIALAFRLHFNVSSAGPGFVVLNLRDYPSWRIIVNGRTAVDRERRKDGLITLPIPTGVSKVDVTYAQMPDQIAGWFLSAFSSAILLFIWWRRDEHPSRLRSGRQRDIPTGIVIFHRIRDALQLVRALLTALRAIRGDACPVSSSISFRRAA
jgi:hypothetical protein